MNSNPFLAAYNFPGYIQNNQYRHLYGFKNFAVPNPPPATSELAPVPTSTKHEKRNQKLKAKTAEMTYCYQKIRELIHPGSNAFMSKQRILRDALEMLKAQKSMITYLETVNRRK